MNPPGIAVAELIKQLQVLEAKHGKNTPVHSGGGEYPEGIENAKYMPKGNAYYPDNCIVIY